jgi:Xaa-Pro aminopeptidase
VPSSELADLGTRALGGVVRGDLGSRVARLMARLGKELSAEGMLVSDPANIRYLTGFAGASTGLLLLPQRRVLITDARYLPHALRTVAAPHLASSHTEVVDQASIADIVGDALPASARLVIEGESLSMAQCTRLEAELPEIELVPTGDIILEQRLVKDIGEIARMRAAAAITDAAVEDLLLAEPLGWSELEISSFLIERLVALGAERAAFEPIAAVGERSALAHSHPSRARLTENMILLLDVGAEVDGYKADLTRTVWWGDLTDEVESAVATVRKAYDAAVAVLRPGVRCRAVDDAAREVLRSHDLEHFMIHPTGHNVGLEIHERPYLGQRYEGELVAGNVVTIEPGVYLPDLGGVRIEDTFVVTDAGPIALTMATPSGQVDRRATAIGQ